jgi:hypothetical protein
MSYQRRGSEAAELNVASTLIEVRKEGHICLHR